MEIDATGKRTAQDKDLESIRKLEAHKVQLRRGIEELEQKQKALQAARDKIRALYADPPSLAPHFRSLFAVPLEHRLKMSLQAAVSEFGFSKNDSF